MNNEVQSLYDKLKLNDKIKYSHDLAGRILPFFTRESERAKFKNGFNPIIGVIAREINNKPADLKNTSIDVDTEAVNTTVNAEIVQQLFSTEMYQGMHNSKLTQYVPLSEGADRQGEIQIGDFLVGLLHLRENQIFKLFFHEEAPANLYEKVIFDSLHNQSTSHQNRDYHFIYRNSKRYAYLFACDVKNMMLDKDYFYNNIGLLLKYYYFFYITQCMSKVGRSDASAEMVPLYFSLDNEAISQSRQAVTTGYRQVYDHGKKLLVDVDIVNYLNVLIPDSNRFYWKDEILSEDFPYKTSLLSNLQMFLRVYAQSQQLDFVEQPVNLTTAISLLKSWLKVDATNSRYPKSFEEIAKQGFVSRHGRIGNTFSLSSDMVLMLTAVIVGKKKQLLDQVFKALQERGIYMDRLTRDSVIELYERANILEKLSDSGDAQYVKSVF